jgi:hypothetical protein
MTTLTLSVRSSSSGSLPANALAAIWYESDRTRLPCFCAGCARQPRRWAARRLGEFAELAGQWQEEHHQYQAGGRQKYEHIGGGGEVARADDERRHVALPRTHFHACWRVHGS